MTCSLCPAPATRSCKSHEDHPIPLCDRHFYAHADSKHRRRFLEWLIENYDLPGYGETVRKRVA